MAESCDIGTGKLRRTIQETVDRFYAKRGPCCAGCDWWQWLNSVAGDCTRSVPVSGSERFSMLGERPVGMTAEAGHIVTPRDHCCGDFEDKFDWRSLQPEYLRRIGMTVRNETRLEGE